MKSDPSFKRPSTAGYTSSNLSTQSKGTDNQEPSLLNDQLESVELDEEDEIALDLPFQLEALNITIIVSHL